MATEDKNTVAPRLDTNTIALARRDDRRALGAIWQVLNPKLLRFIRTLGAQEPEDIASQVWVEVARNLHRLDDDPHKVAGLLFTIARRRCIDEHRRLKRQSQRSLDSLNRAHTPAWQPIAEIESSLDAEALLRRLAPEIAELIALRVIAGFSNTEISTITGKSEGAIRVATHRGLRQLQTLLDSSASKELSVTNPTAPAIDQL